MISLNDPFYFGGVGAGGRREGFKGAAEKIDVKMEQLYKKLHAKIMYIIKDR